MAVARQADYTGKGPFRNKDGSAKDGEVLAFLCPMCGSETNKLIASEISIDFTCLSCDHPSVRSDRHGMGPNLHANVGTDKTSTLTVGKAWEIDNRMVSREDKKTVINRKTGREAQY